jgi:hypothetical protein
MRSVGVADELALTDDDLARIEHRARRSGSGNCWTGQSGSLAADVMRLLAERRRLLAIIATMSEGEDSTPWWEQPHD